MNANARRIHSRGLQLRALCWAITIALALPLAVLAQDNQLPPEGTATPQNEPEKLNDAA